MRKKKRPDRTEYGQPYCRFGFLLNFQCTWSILFNKVKDGSVRANFVSKCNDPLMNQHNRIRFQSWIENCDLKILLDG